MNDENEKKKNRGRYNTYGKHAYATANNVTSST